MNLEIKKRGMESEFGVAE